jgi:Kef-type K+ transport system membrane component KefB
VRAIATPAFLVLTGDQSSEAITILAELGVIILLFEKRKELDGQVIPIADIFVPIFFVTMGAKVDLSVLNPAIPSNREGLIIAAII